jgi:hypothetical protein
MQYESSVNRKTALFRVTFRFDDDSANERRTTLVDAVNSLDAMRQVNRMYDNVAKIYRAERTS